MNAAGREALDDGRATVLAVLSRAFALVPSADGKRALGQLRAQATAAMPGLPEPTQSDTFMRVLGAPAQAAAAAPAAGPAAPVAGATAARALLDANMAVDSAAQPWRELASVVIGVRDLLPAPALSASPQDASGTAADSAGTFVRDLLTYLTGQAGADPADTVAARLFDLHVARYVMQPDGVIADQALELIQMSSDTRTCLDPRTLATEKLTGLQLHHFGAFYKASWRANDWMWGRLDGAGWLVHMLLDPRRLRELADQAPDPAAFVADLRVSLQQIVGAPAPPGVWEPFAPQGGHPAAAAEMDFLTDPAPPPPPVSLPVTAIWVAAGLQRLIAAEELAHVAEQISNDTKAGAEEAPARPFLSAYHHATGAASGSFPPVPEAKATEVLHACQVSAEKLAGEMGSKLFTQTVTRAAAVSVKAVDMGKAVPSFLRPVLASARAVTSLAYRVTSVGPAAQYPLLAGLALIALGVLASTSTINVLSAAGLVAVLAGLLLVAVGAARRIVLALAILTAAAGAALAAAAYIPVLRDHIFPWLQKTAVPSLAKHPAQWAILVAFVLLPPLWTIVAIVRRMARVAKSRPPTDTRVLTRKEMTSTPSAAVTEPEPNLAQTG